MTDRELYFEVMNALESELAPSKQTFISPKTATESLIGGARVGEPGKDDKISEWLVNSVTNGILSGLRGKSFTRWMISETDFNCIYHEGRLVNVTYKIHLS